MMDKKSVNKLFHEISFDDKDMDTSLAEAFFKEHSGQFPAWVNGKFYDDYDETNVLIDRKKNKIFPSNFAIVSQSNEWEQMSYMKRSKIFNSIATAVRDNSLLFAQIDYAIRGVSAKDTQYFDIPLIVDFFQYYANYCRTEKYPAVLQPIKKGLVYMSNVSPMVSLGWLVAPALAAGCNVVIWTTSETTAFTVLFAKLCLQAGLPAGSLNILPCDGNFYTEFIVGWSYIGTPNCIKADSRAFGKENNLFLSNQNGGTMIVTETADVDSSIDAIFSAAWSHNGMLPWSLRRIIIQESIATLFSSKLALKVKSYKPNRLSTGFVHGDITKAINDLLHSWSQQGIKHYDIHDSFNGEIGDNYLLRPIVMKDSIPLPDRKTISDRDYPLPIVLTQTYRTTKELINMVNSEAPIALSVWCEKMSIANEISLDVKVNRIWINSYGQFSPTVPFSGRESSGFGKIGRSSVSFYDLAVKTGEGNPLFKEWPLKEKGHKLDEVNACADNVEKLQSLWRAKSHEQKAQTFRLLAEKLTNSFDSYKKKQTDLYELPESLAAYILEKSIDFLQNAALMCFNVTQNCAVLKKSLCYQIREPLGTILIDPNYDLLHEFIVTVTAISVLGNAVIYRTQSKLIIEVCKEFSLLGLPVVVFVHQDSSSLSVSNDTIKDVWKLPDSSEELETTKSEVGNSVIKNHIQNLLDLANCKEMLEDRFSFTKTVWTTFGETFSN